MAEADLFLVAMFAASQAALYYTVKYMMKQLESGGDPERQKQLEKGNKALERIGLKDADLDEYERKCTLWNSKLVFTF